MTSQPIRPFHLALPCQDLGKTQAFYCDILGCSLGRTSESWIDLNVYGHQLVFHDCGGETLQEMHNPVDQHAIPVPHFGIVLVPSDFDALATRLDGKVDWILEPSIRFENTAGEQKTLFFRDPNNYALEFKSFADDRFLFEPFES